MSQPIGISYLMTKISNTKTTLSKYLKDLQKIIAIKAINMIMLSFY
jgi:hypothetical protein